MAREYLVSAGESTKPKRLSIGRRGLQEPKTRGRLAGLVSSTVREKGSAPQWSQGDRAGYSGSPSRIIQRRGQDRSKRNPPFLRRHICRTQAMSSDLWSTCVLQARCCWSACEAATTSRVSQDRSPVGVAVVCRLPPACQGGLLVAAAAVVAGSRPTELTPW